MELLYYCQCTGWACDFLLPLVIKITHKFLFDREMIEQLDTAKVISSSQGVARVTEMCCVHVSFVSFLWPNAYYLLTKNTVCERVCVCVCVCGGRGGGGVRVSASNTNVLQANYCLQVE